MEPAEPHLRRTEGSPRPSGEHRETALEDLLHRSDAWRRLLALDISRREPALSPFRLDAAVEEAVARIIFLSDCEALGIDGRTECAGLRVFVDARIQRRIQRELQDLRRSRGLSTFPSGVLGRVYERSFSRTLSPKDPGGNRTRSGARKASGVYYTPDRIVEYVVESTVGELWRTKKPGRDSVLRVLDPSCGSGAFLVGAYGHLLDLYRRAYMDGGPVNHPEELVRGPDGTWRLSLAEKGRILEGHIFGVELDPRAAEAARLSLILKLVEDETRESVLRQPGWPMGRTLAVLERTVRCGNAVIGPDFAGDEPLPRPEGEEPGLNPFDWETAFPEIAGGGGFDAVIGNPPWGQKEVRASDTLKRYIRDRFPSAKGIYDSFRPFVELGVGLTAEGGRFGMVLPDIVLLKNYTGTRRFLLERLSLEAIDWWGRAFGSAVMDTATVIGRKSPPARNRGVRTAVHHPRSSFRQTVPQADFWRNPRLTFNLFLTPERRSVLRKTDGCPRLGDFFEIHEGVHSGNIRPELFVESRIDDTCRPLLAAGSEIRPYALRWGGRFIRLGALPERRTPGRYANPGRREWHEREKVLVRRTGDHVLAAVDHDGRYASNNFFLMFPRDTLTVDLDGLCTLLNTPFMTWYFRAVEPRRGRAFAELKIKHLAAFPLPRQALAAGEAGVLNDLGARRRALEDRRVEAGSAGGGRFDREAADLDGRIRDVVCAWFGVPADLERGNVEAPAPTGTG